MHTQIDLGNETNTKSDNAPQSRATIWQSEHYFQGQEEQLFES